MKVLLLLALFGITLCQEFFGGTLDCKNTVAINRQIPDPNDRTVTTIRYNSTLASKIGYTLMVGAVAYNIEPIHVNDTAYCNTIRLDNNKYNVSFMIGANQKPAVGENVGIKNSIYLGPGVDITGVSSMITLIARGNYFMYVRQDTAPLVYEELLQLHHPEEGDPKCYFYYSVYSCLFPDDLTWWIVGIAAGVAAFVLCCCITTFLIIMAIIVRKCWLQDRDEY